MNTEIYKITTAGDCEWRSTKDLGLWTGKLEDILLHLASKACYKLDVECVSVRECDPLLQLPTKDTVHFSYTGALHVNKSVLGPSNYHNSRKLTAKGSKTYKDTLARARVLATLTKEQIEALGL